MKSFKQYLTESKKQYNYRVKLAIEPSDDLLDKMERHLAKYDVESVGSAKKLMLQSVPYDFPQLRGYEIYVVDFTTQRPASAYQIQTELQNICSVSDGYMKVRSQDEPLERQEQESLEQTEQEATSILADSEYSEAEKIDGEDYYGDKYNAKFVQELLALRKNKEKDGV